MGQDISKDESAAFKAIVKKLNKMEIKDIAAVFDELSTSSEDGQSNVIKKPTWLNRDKFAAKFGINELLVEQLFETFDHDQNGLIDMQEFVTGMAFCLHGSLKEKCKLLFKVFNLDGDEGVSPEELATVLTSCLQSAHSVLLSTLKSEKMSDFRDKVASQTGEAMMVSVLVDKIVHDAFNKCDVSRNGKLELDEFVQWVHKNPKLVNNIFIRQCPKPEGVSYTNQNFNSEECFDVVGESLENEDEVEGDCSQIENSHPQTLLKMSASVQEPKAQPTLNDLFAKPGGGEEETFFDTISDSLTEEPRVLRNSQSDMSLDQHESDPFKRKFIPPPHVLSASDSLQSITLSQDSLVESREKSLLLAAGEGEKKDSTMEISTVKDSDSEEIGFSLESMKKGVFIWEPSPRVKALLHNIDQGVILDQSAFTFPSVLIEESMGDPLKDLVGKYLGEQDSSKRPVLSAEQVEFNEIGLRRLLKAHCWRAAIDWTTKYLTHHGQGLSTSLADKKIQITPALLQIWYVRMALMVKLRMFSSAEAELNAFNGLEAPDLYFQFYGDTYEGFAGSLVPFSFRLLYAELPQHNGRPNVALDRLYALLHHVTVFVNNLMNGRAEDGLMVGDDVIDDELKDRLVMWKDRHLSIHYSLGNCFLRMKEYTLAVRLFEKVVELEPTKKAFIYSAIGRIYLQLGDLPNAQRYFSTVEQLTNEEPRLDGLTTVNKGYYGLAQGHYEESYRYFSSAVKSDPENISAGNNAAVSLLFLGKVKEASTLLETLVWRTPERNLHEDILLNLNTIYELETSRALQKKHKILDLVCKNKGDCLSVSCLKLS